MDLLDMFWAFVTLVKFGTVIGGIAVGICLGLAVVFVPLVYLYDWIYKKRNP